MANNLDIRLECTGDPMAAFSEAKQICKAGKYETLYIFFNKLGKSIAVHGDSNIVDLFNIYQLETKLKGK